MFQWSSWMEQHIHTHTHKHQPPPPWWPNWPKGWSRSENPIFPKMHFCPHFFPFVTLLTHFPIITWPYLTPPPKMAQIWLWAGVQPSPGSILKYFSTATPMRIAWAKVLHNTFAWIFTRAEPLLITCFGQFWPKLGWHPTCHPITPKCHSGPYKVTQSGFKWQLSPKWLGLHICCANEGCELTVVIQGQTPQAGI